MRVSRAGMPSIFFFLVVQYVKERGGDDGFCVAMRCVLLSDDMAKVLLLFLAFRLTAKFCKVLQSPFGKVFFIRSLGVFACFGSRGEFLGGLLE